MIEKCPHTVGRRTRPLTAPAVPSPPARSAPDRRGGQGGPSWRRTGGGEEWMKGRTVPEAEGAGTEKERTRRGRFAWGGPVPRARLEHVAAVPTSRRRARHLAGAHAPLDALHDRDVVSALQGHPEGRTGAQGAAVTARAPRRMAVIPFAGIRCARAGRRAINAGWN